MDGYRDALMLAASGAAGVCAFDALRALRRSMRPPFLITAVLDLLSVAAFTAAVWLSLLRFAHGELRICSVLCSLCGIVLYVFTVRRLLFRLFCAIFEKFFVILRFIFKILLTPARFFYKIIGVRKNPKGNGDDTGVQEDRQVSRQRDSG